MNLKKRYKKKHFKSKYPNPTFPAPPFLYPFSFSSRPSSISLRFMYSHILLKFLSCLSQLWIPLFHLFNSHTLFKQLSISFPLSLFPYPSPFPHFKPSLPPSLPPSSLSYVNIKSYFISSLWFILYHTAHLLKKDR